MDRIRRFQRTMIVLLCSINTLVYTRTFGFSWANSIKYTLLSALATLCIVLAVQWMIKRINRRREAQKVEELSPVKNRI